MASGCAQPSLEEKAAAALAEGRPHLATLLLRKANARAPLTLQGVLLRARARAAEQGPHAALADVEHALEVGVSPEEVLSTAALRPLTEDPAVERAIARGRRGGGAGASFPSAPPGAVDAQALSELVDAAAASHTSALIVLRDGALVGEWYFGQPRERIEAMSATKSILSLAVGLLMGDGRLSLQTRVAELFPQWRGTPKEAITVGHLLSHSSGLRTKATTEDIYPQQDFVRYALEAPLEHPPGSVFAYNNSATNLLAGVVEKAAGEPLDELLHRRLFQPLGISDVTWTRDPAGNRHGMSGLQIHPLDLARVGQLLLDGGRVNGVQLLPASYLSLLELPAQPHDPTAGPLWWITPRTTQYRLEEPFFTGLRGQGVARETLEKLQPYRGRALSEQQLRDLLQLRLRPFEARLVRRASRRADALPTLITEGAPFAISARGYLSNILMIAPGERLVVVRMSASRRAVDPADQELAVEPLARRLVEPDWDRVELPGLTREAPDER